MSETRYRSKPEGYRSKPESRSKLEIRSKPERRSKPEGGSKPERKKGRPIVLGAGIAMLIATIVFAVVLIPWHETNGIAELPSALPIASLSSSPGASSTEPAATTAPSYIKDFSPPAAVPFIYESANKVFLVSGSNRISLKERSELYGCYQSVNSMFSGDNRYLYYILGLDKNTGAGTLMVVTADGASDPATIAEGVCAANVSYDGKKVMYITDIAGTAGTLYLKDGEKTEQIAQNVVPLYYQFSYDGEYISYIVQESDETFAMYVKRSEGSPELVIRITAAAVTDNGVSVTRFSEAAPLCSGQVLYSIEENDNMPLYLFTCGGGTERLCNDGYIVKSFTSGGFLYAETGQEARPLWYKAPGKEPVLVSENYDYIKFLQDGPINESRFLLVEHIGEDSDNPGVMMYEAEPGGEKIAISLAAGEEFEINKSFNCVAYERDSKLYVSRKTEAGWKEAYLSNASRQEFQGAYSSGVIAKFDESGENLYYFDEYKTSPLYRYSVHDGVTAKIVDNADWFCVLGDIPYSHTAGDKLYRGADKPKMILEGVRKVMETRGGAYLLTGDGSVCFIADGEDNIRILDSFSKTAALSGSIRYYPPLEKDSSGAIEVLAGEVNYCLYKLGVFRDRYAQPLSVDEAVTLTAKLLAREDIGAGERSVLEKMHAGFESYTLWTGGKGKRSAAASALESAAESCSKYLAGAGDEE